MEKSISSNNTKINLDHYLSTLNNSGIKAIRGDRSTLWVEHEKFSVVRFPEFCTDEPLKHEIDRIFRQMKCLVINYTVISKIPEHNQAFLYNCSDPEYSIESLASSSVRRNIRLARRHLKVGFCDWADILQHGFIAFSDTRRKVGLSDGTRKNFQKRFQKFSRNPAHKAAAVWFEDKMAGFLSLIVVEDYVIIQGTFSTEQHKSMKPNNLLIDFVLNHYLKENKFSLVCYGLSTVQDNTSHDGLHTYKVQVGFDAIPVKRVFVLHPALKSVEILLRGIIKLLLKLSPTNRILRKATGLFNQIQD